ncbi:MAG: methylenetetrahydrofolate reductase [NAD(P)H] [Imperialibacter sp.]
MKVVDHINNAKKTLFSFEILPPLKGQSMQAIIDTIEPLMEFKPPFVDVTYHREEYMYKKRQDGLLEKVTIRKRPGTVGICAAIINRFKIDAVPHIICGGFSKDETEDALIDLDFLGIDNVLVLRGDPIKSEGAFVADPNGHKYASELLEQVINMNNGRYLHEETEGNHTNFCIGVAGYPEKHFEAPNLSTDIRHLKRKVEMGAQYIVTQMFFDNSEFFAFEKKCREEGITVPIIPGLKPITSVRQMTALPRSFFINLPNDLVNELEKCKDNKAAKAVGIEWCINQSKELMAGGVPVLHYYTMSRAESVKDIASALF